jgi:uncharacterized protein YdcH (DUF465 family)
MARFMRLTNRMDEVKPPLHTIIDVNRSDETEVGEIHGHVFGLRFTRLFDELHDVEGKLNSMEVNLLHIADAQFSAILKEVQGLFLDNEIRSVAIAVWASMVAMTKVKTDVPGTMRTKVKEWASRIGVEYKARFQIQLISIDPRLCLCRRR